MNKQTIYDIDVAGKTVYVRVDTMFPATKTAILLMTEESVPRSRPSDIY